MLEHMIATRRHNPRSLMVTHKGQKDHAFNLGAIYIVHLANTTYPREFLKARHSSTNSINRQPELDQIHDQLKRKT